METSLGIQSNLMRKLKPALFGNIVRLDDPPGKKKEKRDFLKTVYTFSNKI